MSYGFKIIVAGDYACFTRPEHKIERVSYEVPTPGALEGMLKAIYWKPAIRYVIDRIIVLNPIKFANFRRNEVKKKVSYVKMRRAMADPSADPTIYTKDDRTQKSAMILKDVRYAIEFHFELTGIRSDHEGECEEKHCKILGRRLKNGQWFKQPYLGCREFPVKELVLVDSFDGLDVSSDLWGDVDLGHMLYHMEFEDKGLPVNGNWEDPKFSDRADAVYYHPHMVEGVINVKTYRREADVH